MDTQTQELLNKLRQKRNFNVDEYIKLKCIAINKFFEDKGMGKQDYKSS